MKDLKITKGEWNQCCKDTSPHFVFAGEEKTVCSLSSNEKGTENYEPIMGEVTMAERIANAALIADAGNCYQKCSMLPSELLKQNEELREALAELVHLHGCEQEGLLTGQPTPDQWYKAVEKAEQALKNSER